MDEVGSDRCKVGFRSRKKSGQKKCLNCQKSYNNAAIPEYCTGCNQYLGGKYKPLAAKLDAKLLTDSLASTRVNVAGPNIRTFVSIGEEKKVRCQFKQNYKTKQNLQYWTFGPDN